MTTPVTNHLGMTFANEAEKQAWEAYVQARIDAALRSPLLSDAKSKARRDNLLARLAEKVKEDVPHPLA